MSHYDDDKLKDYLLGKLPADEAEAIEVAVATNVTQTERLFDVECELIDDYLSNRLSAANAQSFERDYLVTETRLTKFRIAEGLRQLGRPKVAAAAAGRSFGAGFGYRTFATVGLVIVFIGGGLAIYKAMRPAVEIAAVAIPETPLPKISAPVEIPPTPSANASPEVRPAVVQQTPGAIPKPVPSRTPVVVPSAPNLSVKLSPGSLRGDDEQSVTIPANTKTVTLYLRSDARVNRFSHFHVILKTPEDGLVMTANELSSPKFTIDASKLENRTYVLTLEGELKNESVESIADYTFRVRR